MNKPVEKPTFDLKVFRNAIHEDHATRVKKIEELAASVDAEFAFQALATYKISALTREGYKETEHGLIPALLELAAFYLYPHFGHSDNRDPGRIQAIIDALTELNQFRGINTAFQIDSGDPEFDMLQVQTRLNAEAVRGSSYPPQTKRRIENIQGEFETWFHRKAGIGPLLALKVFDAFDQALNDNFHATKAKFNAFRNRADSQFTGMESAPQNSQPARDTEDIAFALKNEFLKLMEEMSQAPPPSFEQIAKIVPELGRTEWNALRNLIGLTPESRKQYTEPRDIKARPVYFLSKDRFILVDLSSAYDALFDAFDQLTRTESSFRDKHYCPHLSKWMESEVYSYMLRLFPADAVYQQLLYPDPDHPGGEAELDVAVKWGRFLVLCEVKGKQFRPRSRIGDPSRLRSDLKDNIEEAFDQTARATRFIQNSSQSIFVEKGSGRKLVVKKDYLIKIFPISVTLHHFGGLATQLAVLKNIGLFKGSAYPWSVSLADIDIVCRFAGNPDVFLHYVQRRLDMQRSEKRIVGDELDAFGLYLDTRLHPSQYWDKKMDDGSDISCLIMSGGSERFDTWYLAEQELGASKPEIKLDVPPRFSSFLNELRARDDDNARYIAFALLGLSPDAVNAFEGNIQNICSRVQSPGQVLRSTLKDVNTVVTVIAAMGLSTEQLQSHTAARASIEKYKMKAYATVAFGINVADSTKPFDCAIWGEGPWVEDPSMDAALEKECLRIPPGQTLPGRNQPCVCGSGRKFKKCCLHKIVLME